MSDKRKLYGIAPDGSLPIVDELILVPERTCFNLNGVNCRSMICSACGESTMKDACDPVPEYCAHCGAKVVG